MTLIKIIRSPYSKGTTLDVNGQRANVPAEGETGDIPAELLPALADSHIDYEILGDAAGEAGVGAGGIAGDAPAEIAAEPDVPASEPTEPEGAAEITAAAEPDPPADEPEQDQGVNDADDKDYITALSVLDKNVAEITAALPGLSDDAVRALKAAEEGGKTRKTLLAAMNERLNPPATE